MAVPFKNFLFVTSLAEERGKGEFGSLSKTRGETVAYRLTEGDEIEEVKPSKLNRFTAADRTPGGPKGPKMLARLDPTFDGPGDPVPEHY
jgi:hypothetical protein